MQYIIVVGSTDFPKNEIERKSRGKFGPFDSEASAMAVLQNKGWQKTGENEWRSMPETKHPNIVANIRPITYALRQIEELPHL